MLVWKIAPLQAKKISKRSSLFFFFVIFKICKYFQQKTQTSTFLHDIYSRFSPILMQSSRIFPDVLENAESHCSSLKSFRFFPENRNFRYAKMPTYSVRGCTRTRLLRTLWRRRWRTTSRWTSTRLRRPPPASLGDRSRCYRYGEDSLTACFLLRRVDRSFREKYQCYENT